MNAEQRAMTDEQLTAADAEARDAWRRLRLRLRAVTPSGVAHALLIIGAAVTIGWVIRTSWPALLPFAVGGVVAYTVLPLVNRLDAHMPRPLAALLTMLVVALLGVLILWAIVPPLAQELNRAFLALRDVDDGQQYLDRLGEYTSRLPAPVRELLQRGAEQAVTNLRAELDQHLDRPVRTLLAGLLVLLNSIGFVLGFLVVPTWLLAVLNDQRAAVRVLNRSLPGWLAPDFWGVVRILDQIFGTFVRGRIVLGLAVGVGNWIGLTLLDAASGQAGVQAGQFAILLAVVAGILQLVPTIGPIVAALLSAVIGLTFSPAAALFVLLIFVVVQLLAGRLIAPRLERRVVDLSPAILVMAIAALGQFGLLWVFLAAPLVAVARDLFRYTYGRVAAPPRPAGMLFDAGRPAPAAVQPGATPPLPLAYRRGRAARQS
jgi:predicted PurR-regulated permease PerM